MRIEVSRLSAPNGLQVLFWTAVMMWGASLEEWRQVADISSELHVGKNVRKTHGMLKHSFSPSDFFRGGYPKTPFVAVFRSAHPSNTIPVLSSC